jgi:hypothetical protein
MSDSAETPVRTITTRNRGWGRFLAVALLLHIPLFVYPVLRLCDWLNLDTWLTVVIFVPLVSSQIISRIYLRNSRSGFVRSLRRTFDLWLGISPILLGLLLAAEICVLVFNADASSAAWWVIDLSLVIGLAGFIAALSPSVRKIVLTSTKVTEPLRFVQITDVHIGSRSSRFLEKVMHKILRRN